MRTCCACGNAYSANAFVRLGKGLTAACETCLEAIKTEPLFADNGDLLCQGCGCYKHVDSFEPGNSTVTGKRPNCRACRYGGRSEPGTRCQALTTLLTPKEETTPMSLLHIVPPAPQTPTAPEQPSRESTLLWLADQLRQSRAQVAELSGTLDAKHEAAEVSQASYEAELRELRQQLATQDETIQVQGLEIQDLVAKIADLEDKLARARQKQANNTYNPEEANALALFGDCPGFR